MTDTGQPLGAPENVDLQNAADAFKAIISPQPERPRDEAGRFAPKEPAEAPAEAVEGEEQEIEAAEGEAPEAAESEAEQPTDTEAADEAQPEDDVPLPASWAKEDADLWQALPANAKAKIFAREAQRDQAVNLKFQEAANARKAAEAQAQEAAANRDRYLQEIGALKAAIQPAPPPVSMLQPNSPNYDPDTYHLLRAEYEQASQFVQQLEQQAARAHAESEAQRQAAEAAAFEAVENEWRPKLFASVPELNSPEKAPQVFAELGRYGSENGFTADELAQADARDILMLWKAAQFDKQQAAAQRMKATAKPQPKPASPAVKPGVQTPTSLVRQSVQAKQMERLSKSGSLEDAAAMFKLIGKR